MKAHAERPIPLAKVAREQDPAQVGLYIRSAIAAPVEDTPCVKWRIRNTLHRRIERRTRVLRFALVGAVIFVTGGMVGAVVQPLFRTHAPSSAPSPTERTTTSAPRPRLRLKLRPQPSAIEEAAGLDPPAAGEAAREQPPLARTSLSTTPEATPKLASSRLAKKSTSLAMAGQPATAAEPKADAQQARPLTPPAIPAPVSPTPQAGERALIATALGKLRNAREPAAALALLDEYRERFPDGMLAPEAYRLRTEALLRMGRKATVLDELEQTLPPNASADDERLVLRGELRAAAGRWRAALADFHAVVRDHPAGSVSDLARDGARMRGRIERALWGRAAARSHIGDDEGARADLRQYVRRFPRGRFAAQAVHLLDEKPSP